MRYLVLAGILLTLLRGFAGDAAPAVVSNVHLVSDKVEDVSSLEAWKRSFIKPGMSDKEKALAVFNTSVKFRHQDAPPIEFAPSEGAPIDPIKIFNVYGYCMCNGASGTIINLARAAGLQARGWGIQNHSVSEVFWDNNWHLLDSSLIVYFQQPDGHIAGVEEISEAVDAWYAQNPGYKGDDNKLMQFMRGGGWKKGPAILSHTNFYDINGWLPAATHGWYSTMHEYANRPKLFHYEYGAAMGYKVNVQLRPGEKLTRRWSNQGLHVNLAEGGDNGSIRGVPGKGDMRYSPQYGDLAPGRIGNGEHEFVALASRDLRSALRAENVRIGADFTTRTPVLSLIKEGLPGEVVYRLPSSYVYLGGTLQFDNMHANRRVSVEFSRNHGLDWKEIAATEGVETLKVELKPHIHRLYDYQVRLKLAPFSSIENIVFKHTVQHSQRVLPALAQGSNTLTFSAGPPEGTLTLEGSLDPKNAGKNLVYTEFHPQMENIGGTPLFLTSGLGQITFPVRTPGDMARIRVGLHYRARDKADGLELLVSFDEGKSFKPFGSAPGPVVGFSITFVCGEIPPGTRSAMIRFAGKQRNATGILDFRIDADYAEPHGGFRPVKITYNWAENGVEKSHVHVAKTEKETYTIQCEAKPELKSYSVELAE